jgi:signal transduction histidine kinase
MRSSPCYALSYRSDGGAQCRVGCSPRRGQITCTASREQDWVAVVVEDTGCGLAPEELARIWERLYRGDKSRAQRELG